MSISAATPDANDGSIFGSRFDDELNRQKTKKKTSDNSEEPTPVGCYMCETRPTNAKQPCPLCGTL